jgi:hypothetical protein
MEPQRQLCEILCLDHLTVEYVLAELLVTEGKVFAALLKGFVDPDQMSQEITLLTEVGTEHLVGHAPEE